MVRGIGVRLMQPGGARAQGAVDEQVTGQPGRTGVVERAHAPVPGWSPPHPSSRSPRRHGLSGTQFAPVVQPADLGAGAFVHRDDPVGGRGVQRGQPGFGALGVRQQVTRGGADQMMGVADQAAAVRQIRSPTAVRRPARADRSTPARSARRPGPGRRADHPAPRPGLRCSARRSPATTIRPNRDPRPAGRDGRPHSRRSAAGNADATSKPANRARSASDRSR